MAPTMRVPTVEFRSLLLPPIIIPIRAFQTLYRPQCASHVPRPACPAQRLEQRRALNLYKTAKSKTVLGQHKILNFSPYDVNKIAPLGTLQHRVKLWETTKTNTKTNLIADSISLQELYNNHIKPGQILYCLGEVKKGIAQTHLDAEDMELAEELKDFSITTAHTFKAPGTIRPTKGKQLGGLKNVIFNESSPITFFRMVMDRAYQFIDAGLAVEFRTRLQGKKLLKEERIKPAGPERWTWMHSHFPHLRPDFIMKAMPPSTRYLVHPMSDGRTVQWVAAKPAKIDPSVNLDQRVARIKDSVTKSIEAGHQAMLPKVMRQQLRESGLEHYSIHTGLPRAQARAKYAKGGKPTYGGEEKKRFKSDAETDRFLQPDEDAGPPIRTVAQDAFTQGGHRWEQRGHIGHKKKKYE